MSDIKSDNDGDITYDEMEQLVDVMIDKCESLQDTADDLRVENTTLSKYYNIALDQIDTMKIRISKYEPTNNSEKKIKRNKFRDVLATSEDKINNLRAKKLEEMQKKRDELYKASYNKRVFNQ